MKILIATDWYAPVINGVVTSVLNLKRGLEERGHEVRVLTLSQNLDSTDADGVVRIGSVSFGKIYPGARFRTSPGRALIRELIEWKPDVIHTQCEFSTFVIARRIAKRCNAPIVHTYHTVYEDYTHYFCPSRRVGRAIVRQATGWVANMVDRIIAPTDKVKNLLEDYSVRVPVDVIPSGIAIERFARQDSAGENAALRATYGLRADGLVLVSVCRLAAEKNIEELLRCFAACSDVDATLVLVGDGPHRRSIESEIERLGLSERVVMTGMVPPSKVPAYYRIGDLFVSASTSETQGLTYIEALAAGVPVLCRRDACLDEVVFDSVNGWQFSSLLAFGDCLRKFASDAELRNTMAKNALMSSQRYSVEVFASTVEDIYIRALNDKGTLTCQPLSLIPKRMMNHFRLPSQAPKGA